MSNVTNLILSFSIAENEEARTADVNAFFNNGKGFNIVSIDFENEKNSIKRWYGGSKMMEAQIFMGAFNHLDLDGLINHLKEIDWEEPEIVQLILKEQDDDKFRIIDLN